MHTRTLTISGIEHQWIFLQHGQPVKADETRRTWWVSTQVEFILWQLYTFDICQTCQNVKSSKSRSPAPRYNRVYSLVNSLIGGQIIHTVWEEGWYRAELNHSVSKGDVHNIKKCMAYPVSPKLYSYQHEPSPDSCGFLHN